MSKFIKLSNSIINTTKIVKIDISQNIYTIHLLNFNFCGFVALGSGIFDSKENFIEICKKTNYEDHQIIEKWINNIKYQQ
jgi:hypothetical protein